MTLADEIWTECSIYEVYAAFLKAERYKYVGEVSQETLNVIDRPNLTDPGQNAERIRLIYWKRAQIVGEIPPDTRWCSVHTLRLVDHVNELRVIRSADWIDPVLAPKEDRRLTRVAAWRKKPMTDSPDYWEPPILWGHSKQGPFTIMEGNNRLTALAYNEPSSRRPITVYIGISHVPCYWHESDPLKPLLYTYWKSSP